MPAPQMPWRTCKLGLDPSPLKEKPNLESKVAQKITHCHCLRAVWGVKTRTLLILDFLGQTNGLKICGSILKPSWVYRGLSDKAQM